MAKLPCFVNCPPQKNPGKNIFSFSEKEKKYSPKFVFQSGQKIKLCGVGFSAEIGEKTTFVNLLKSTSFHKR